MADEISTKLINLFEFVKEMNLEKVHTNFLESPDIRFHVLLTEDNLAQYSSDHVKTDFSEDADYYFSVQLPDLGAEPPDNSSSNTATVDIPDETTLPALTSTLPSILQIGFQDNTDSDGKENKYGGFSNEQFNPWQARQIVLWQTRKFFYEVYEGLYKAFQQGDGMYDLFLGRVWLKGSCEQGEVNYPLLFQPVNIEFDSKNSRILVSRGFGSPQRNDRLLMKLGLSDPNYINENLSYNIFKEGIVDDFADAIRRQEQSINGFEAQDGFVLFLRNKSLNLSTSINAIVDDLRQKGDDGIPPGIMQFVQPAPMGMKEEHDSNTDMSKAAGYDEDALLAKPANEAQINLVKSLGNISHILVQGPPGTGKTHTIANLIGNLLTQGKSVLVSSYTSKALRVLRDKLPEDLQDYCVSVFPDSNPERLISKTVNRVTDDCSLVMSKGEDVQIQEIERQRLLRKELLGKAADLRTRLYKAVLREKQSDAINICGEKVSLSKAAEFMAQHRELADNIPGAVRTDGIGIDLPMSETEIEDLYLTNKEISTEEEQILSRGLPETGQLPKPEELRKIYDEIEKCRLRKQETESKIQEENAKTFTISDTDEWTLKNQSFQSKDIIRFCESVKKSVSTGRMALTSERGQLLKALKDILSYLRTKEKWEQEAIYDYIAGNESPWEELDVELQKFINIFQEHRALLIIRQDIECDITERQQNQIQLLRQELLEHGKVRWFRFSLSKLQQAIKINGHMPKTADDIFATQISLELREILNSRIIPLWKNLDIPDKDLKDIPFSKLYQSFASIAKNIQEIRNEQKNISDAIHLIKENGDFEIPCDLWNNVSSKDIFWNILIFSFEYQKNILELDLIEEDLKKAREMLTPCMEVLRNKCREEIPICQNLLSSIEKCDMPAYDESYKELIRMQDLNPLLEKRNSYLQKMYEFAPKWAESIKERNDRHGLAKPEFDIALSWKYKQYESIIKNAQNTKITDLQDELLETEHHIRQQTEDLIENQTRLSIVRKINSNPTLLSSLKTLQASFKKLGKGKGKMASQIKNQILNLTNKAKDAIPVWVMPLGAALEQFVPTTAQFDVLILDEASQMDLKALILIYMAKKIVIVGDDAQTTPNAIGATIDNLNALHQKYHLAEYFPRMYHLFSPEYSIYDFAQQSNFMPIMLTEHFRCVPEIIGFSNSLSYGNKIRPLRDASKVQRKPAMVSYHVPYAKEYKNSINITEAQHIAALIYGCLQQPEYENASFGIISLRKPEQAKKIMSLLLEYLGAQCCDRHHILSGLSRDFQGDERDVMFLSMVDVPNENGQPLRLQTADGKNDQWRKIYNVAVSRARDQLWLVHSVSKDQDLQANDIRRTLLDWIDKDRIAQEEQRRQHEESSFEAEVGKALSEKGYKLDALVSIGAYLIDLVAGYQDKKVAIECDGEAYNSSPEQIQADMHRQAILERCGWQFERIRGSHYYSDREGAIANLISRLNKHGVYPETAKAEHSSDLMERIQASADKFMQEHFAPKKEKNKEKENKTKGQQKKEEQEDNKQSELKEDNTLPNYEKNIPEIEHKENQ